MSKLSTKDKLLNYLFNRVNNKLTVEKAQDLFGITNVSARINELRKEGFAIYTNTKTLENGKKIRYYRLGPPSKRYLKALRDGRLDDAARALINRRSAA